MLIHHKYVGLPLHQIFKLMAIATRWCYLDPKNQVEIIRSDKPQTHTVVPQSRFHLMMNGHEIASFEMKADATVRIYHPQISDAILREEGLGGEIVNPGTKSP